MCVRLVKHAVGVANRQYACCWVYACCSCTNNPSNMNCALLLHANGSCCCYCCS
jgi:hypothetical protein